MAAKRSGCLTSVISAVFSAVIAPIAVSFAVKDKGLGEKLPIPREKTHGAGEPEQVIVQGVGWTAEEALQDAFRNALRSTVPITGAWNQPSTPVPIIGPIASYRNVSHTIDWHQGRQYWRRTIVVTLPRGVAEKL